MSFNPICFFVEGVPASAGSKRAFVSKSGKVSMVDTCKAGPSWRESVRSRAFEVVPRNPRVPLILDPIELYCVFYCVRPRNHYGTGRNSDVLKPNAPLFPTKPPDTTKLVRAVEDALNMFVWRDDSQVVVQVARKLYGPRPGCEVTIAPACCPVDHSLDESFAE